MAHPVLPGLLGLLCIGLVGRVALAALPRGPIGSHRLRALPLTWAASHCLGTVLLGLSTAITRSPGWSGLAPALGLAALFLFVRVATLPGAMVPRHEPREPRESWPTRLASVALGAALLAAVAGSFLRPMEAGSGAGLPAHEIPIREIGGAARMVALVSGFPGVPAGTSSVACVALATLAAWILLVADALRTARRDVAGRRLLAGLLALPPLLALAPGPDLQGILLLGSGAAAGVAWVRRADGRALWLAAILVAGAGLARPLVAAVALALLLASSAAPARAQALRAALTALALVALPLLLGREDILGSTAAGLGRAGKLAFAVPVPLLALGMARLARRRASATTSDPVRIEEPWRELLLPATLGVALLVRGLLAGDAARELAWSYPLLAGAVGLALLPPLRLPLLGLRGGTTAG